MNMRAAYRLLADINTAKAIQRSIQQRSAKPALKRAGRVAVLRTERKLNRKIFKALGL